MTFLTIKSRDVHESLRDKALEIVDEQGEKDLLCSSRSRDAQLGRRCVHCCYDDQVLARSGIARSVPRIIENL
jgi:hypothetical protein